MLSFCAMLAQTPALKGTWELEKGEIRQDSAGVISMIDYQLKDGNIPRWDIYTEFTLGEEKSCSIKLNDRVETGEYSLADDSILILDLILLIPRYHYSLISDTTLVLTRRHYLFDEDGPGKNFLEIKLSYSKKIEKDEN